MGASKKPRKKYRPRIILQDPVQRVLDRLTPVRSLSSILTTIKIKNSEAMIALLGGAAVKQDIDILIGISNVVEALMELGFGAEYRDVWAAGERALLDISTRAARHGRFTPTGPEITALNALMELHDAQMDIITVADMEQALALIEKRRSVGKDLIVLPPVPKHLEGEHET